MLGYPDVGTTSLCGHVQVGIANDVKESIFAVSCFPGLREALADARR